MMFRLITLLVLLRSCAWGFFRASKQLVPSRTRSTQQQSQSAGSEFQELCVTVPEGISKKRVDAFLTTACSNYSRSFLSHICENGGVSVNDKNRDKSFKVNSGDIIRLMVPIVQEDSTVLPENIPLDIIYEDDHIIAVNKPQGMVVHPAVGSPNGTFANALLFHLGSEAIKLFEDISDKNIIVNEIDEFTDDILFETELDLPETPEAANASPRSMRPGIVHRLDKGTSGLLLAAKHSESVAKLSAIFAMRSIKKTYLAICVGHPGEVTIVEPIGRCTKNRQLMTVYDGPPGKLAVSHVRTICFDGKLSACLVRIETGRTHQIRVHLKHRHTPVAGDEAYGNKDWNKKLARSQGIKRPLLHAYETEFTHPFTGEQMCLRAPVPPDMRSLLASLQGSSPVVDLESGFLTCDTVVATLEAGERASKSGFVPMDRLLMQEDHWTSFDLPETDEFLKT